MTYFTLNLLGKTRKETEEKFLEKVSDHKHIKASTKVKAVFFYQLLSQSEKLKYKRIIPNKEREKKRKETISIENPNQIQALSISSPQKINQAIESNGCNKVFVGFQELQRSLKGEFFAQRQQFAQVQNSISGLFAKVNNLEKKLNKKTAKEAKGRSNSNKTFTKEQRKNNPNREMELEDFQEEEEEEVEESSEELDMNEDFEEESESSQSHSGNFYIFDFFIFIFNRIL